VLDQDVSKYGIVDGAEIETRLFQINQLIEKPSIGQAPSNLAILGRYILTPTIFQILSKQKPGVGNEIQLTDAIEKLTEFESVYAYDFIGKRYDVGEKLGFIKTTIDMALERDSLRPELLDFLTM